MHSAPTGNTAVVAVTTVSSVAIARVVAWSVVSVTMAMVVIAVVVLATAMVDYRDAVVCVNGVTVIVIVTEDFPGVNGASTGGVTTHVGDCAWYAVPSFCYVRGKH